MAKLPPGERPEQPDELARLPHGRHGLPAEFVERNQRQRLLASMIRIVADGGYNAATINRVAEGAGVTTRTFYKYFDSVEECFLAAFDAGSSILDDRLGEACKAAASWPLQVRAALSAALELFAAEPALARLLLTEPFVAGPAAGRRYQQQIERLAGQLREGRDHYPASAAFPETTERGLVGAIAAQIGRKASAAPGSTLAGLLPDLTQFALTPYLGSAVAREVGVSGTI